MARYEGRAGHQTIQTTRRESNFRVLEKTNTEVRGLIGRPIHTFVGYAPAERTRLNPSPKLRSVTGIRVTLRVFIGPP